MLSEIAELGREQTGEAIRSAAEERLIIVDRDGVRFRHALTRRVIYDGLLPGERRAWHRRVAHGLEASQRGDPSSEQVLQLAHHWHQAGVPARSAPLAYQAGVVAMRRRAFPEAARLLQRAAASWRSGEQPEDQFVAVLSAAAEAARWAGWLGESVQLIGQALEVAGALYGGGQREVRARLLERMGRYQWEFGRPDEMLAAYAAAEAILHDQPAFWAARPGARSARHRIDDPRRVQAGHKPSYRGSGNGTDHRIPLCRGPCRSDPGCAFRS